MTTKKLKIKKGDKVLVITGKEKGKTGEVSSVIKASDKVIVTGVNVVKKHVKPSAGNAGGIVTKELPIHISNVSLFDPESGSAVKVGYKMDSDGNKIRYSKKSGLSL